MASESPRRRARDLVLRALYACESEVVSREETFDSLAAEEDLPEKQLTFAHQLFQLVGERHAWADEQISNLAENWRLERIALIDRTILKIALVELECMTDIPVRVVLNEAIELAKKYSTRESSAFVNGILDRYVKQMPEASRGSL